MAEEAGIVREIDIDSFAWQHMLNYVQDVYTYGRRLTDVAGLNLDAVCDILEADSLKSMLEEMILSNLLVYDVPSLCHNICEDHTGLHRIIKEVKLFLTS